MFLDWLCDWLWDSEEKKEDKAEETTEELQPVIHAYWVHDPCYPISDTYYCSNCGHKHYNRFSQYCDNCGAKMDKYEYANSDISSEWVRHSTGQFFCKNCLHMHTNGTDNYCPNCGAEMKQAKE